jgi:CRISPR-associated protein Csb3
MAEARIPVDLFNPGQVFACLGLLEVTDHLLGDARGGFDWRDESAVTFILTGAGQTCPMQSAIRFLRAAEVASLAPNGSDLTTHSWGVPTHSEDNEFPFPMPRSPATLPAILRYDGKELLIVHWGDDSTKIGMDNTKFWAGSGGYPGAALAKDAIELIRQQGEEELFSDPFNVPAEQSSSFRFDWRRDYVPLDIGFSLNEHSSSGHIINTVGYPLVELLAAIGLTNARPKRISKLEYHYGVISANSESGVIDPVFVRAALGLAPLPFEMRAFRMNLDWPGQENQARCITTVQEISDAFRSNLSITTP